MGASSGDKQAVQLHAWYVGTPGMSSIVRPLSEGVRVHTSRSVHTLQPSPKGWIVVFDDETTAGPFAAVAICIPSAQARNLIGRVEGLADVIARVRMAPAWSLMLHFDQRVLPDQDVFSDMSDVVRWIARNNSKPQRRGTGDAIVVHASPDWCRQAIDLEPQDAAEELWSEVAKLFGLDHVRPGVMTAQLWQHGIVEQSLGESFVYSSHYKIGRPETGALAVWRSTLSKAARASPRRSSIPLADLVAARAHPRDRLRPKACYLRPRFVELPGGKGSAKSSWTLSFFACHAGISADG